MTAWPKSLLTRRSRRIFVRRKRWPYVVVIAALALLLAFVLISTATGDSLGQHARHLADIGLACCVAGRETREVAWDSSKTNRRLSPAEAPG